MVGTANMASANCIEYGLGLAGSLEAVSQDAAIGWRT